ncbi:hypothetical protein FQA39_LY18627 [Lamprigera yunnana]|nr:hypothetical protein FQA39_LY18627 [Lamprigera yunnana]
MVQLLAYPCHPDLGSGIGVVMKDINASGGGLVLCIPIRFNNEIPRWILSTSASQTFIGVGGSGSIVAPTILSSMDSKTLKDLWRLGMGREGLTQQVTMTKLIRISNEHRTIKSNETYRR